MSERIEMLPCAHCGVELIEEGEGWEHPASDDCPLDSLFILPRHVDGWNRRATTSDGAKE